MRKGATVLGVVVLLFAGGLTAQQKRQQDIDLQAAIRTETVDGNLREAIKQFDAIATKYKSDRGMAAQALMHVAECYQKLGDNEARKVYERIVREFGDQKDVVTLALTRLGTEPRASASTGMVLRRVWAGPEVDSEGTVSADGRYISFPDWDTGDLAVRDLSTGTNYHLTRHDSPSGQYSDYAEESAISSDGTQIAYSWFNGMDRYELRLVPLQVSGLPQSRRLYDNEDVVWMAPYDWSPDGRSVVVLITRKDRTAQIGLISTLNGSLRVLKSVDWRGPSKIVFSPDGRYLAFDLPVDDSSNNDRQVFLLAADGSREQRVVSPPGQNRVMGFSPDGTRLLLASDRTGSLGLWALPISDGRPDGQPILVKQDIAPVSVGVTKYGSLFVVATIQNVDVYVALGDTTSGKLLTPPASIASRFLGANTTPEWSPDGLSLAYASARQIEHNTRIIVVRSVGTGQSRDLRVDLNYFGPPRWTPDSRALLVKGSDLKGRPGVYRIDAQTGSLSLVASVIGAVNGQPQISPDGKKVYFWTGQVVPGAKGASFMERNLESGEERAVLRDEGPSWLSLSPDGRYLSGVSFDERARSSSLVLVSVADGTHREVMHASAPESLGNRVSWTPDSRNLIVSRQEGRQTEHLIVPLNDGATRRLELTVPQIRGPIQVHPDGHQIAFAAGQGRGELWTLDNFLPVQIPKK